MKLSFLVLIVLSLLLAPQTRVATRPLVLTHVTVIDVTADQPIKALKFDQTVVITGNRITAIGQADSIRPPQDAQIIDGGGRYLIPGLWDMHVHSLVDNRPDYFFPMFIANGVTGVRDMGSNLSFEQINQIRSDIDSGKTVGPRYGAVAGTILDGAGTQLKVGTSVTDPNQARGIVRSFKQGGADFIKVYDGLSRDVYLAIVDEAKKQKIPVAGHVPFELTATQVSELGQESIEHATDIFFSSATNEKELRNELEQQAKSTDLNALRMQVELKAVSTYEEKKTKSLFARFASNKTWHCPTLIVRRSSTHATNERLMADPRMKYIPHAIRKNWDQTFQRFAVGRVEQRTLRFHTTLLVVGAMQRANVPILAGTDILNPYVFPGFSLHDELALLVEAGLTPMQALRAATANPARYLGMSDSLGTIEKGMLADLVLLDANPLDDIRNTQRIQAVVANGRYFPNEQLRALLVQAEAAAKKQ